MALRCANSSCEIPLSIRASRIARPNAINAGSLACFGEEIGMRRSSAYDADYTTDYLPHPLRMFRVDKSFQLAVPPALEDAAAAGHFHLVQVIGNRTVWLIHALSAPDENGLRWWKKTLVDHISMALKFATLEGWQVKDLYVLAPQHLFLGEALSLRRCARIVECLEPDGSEPCWRIEADGFTFIDSAYGTLVGEEIQKRVVWSRTG